MLWVSLLSLVLATIIDFRKREIPELAAIALLRGRRDIAYTPAMALGLFMLMMTRGVQ